jgi:hypothetical protein
MLAGVCRGAGGRRLAWIIRGSGFPRIGYITLLDAAFLTSFVFCFLCICEIGQMALKLHRSGRWAYPLLYFSALLLVAAVFLTRPHQQNL